MLINTVVQNEAERNERMIRDYEWLIAELPKGSLICRKNEYYYLKYSEDGGMVDKYIGKDEAVIAELRRKLELRKHRADRTAGDSAKRGIPRFRNWVLYDHLV